MNFKESSLMIMMNFLFMTLKVTLRKKVKAISHNIYFTFKSTFHIPIPIFFYILKIAQNQFKRHLLYWTVLTHCIRHCLQPVMSPLNQMTRLIHQYGLHVKKKLNLLNRNSFLVMLSQMQVTTFYSLLKKTF